MYKFVDFKHFIDTWILTTNCLRTADDFRQVTVDYAAEAASYGAVYIEAIFSPPERVLRGIGWDEIYTGYTDGAVRPSSATASSSASHPTCTATDARWTSPRSVR